MGGASRTRAAGHELPKPVWDVAIPQILAISRAR